MDIKQVLFGSTIAVIAILAIPRSAIAQPRTSETACTFRHNQTVLRDRCTVQESENSILMRWSDGISTAIKIKSSMATEGRGGIYRRGIAVVDNADAIFTVGEDTMCFEIPENSKNICFVLW